MRLLVGSHVRIFIFLAFLSCFTLASSASVLPSTRATPAPQLLFSATSQLAYPPHIEDDPLWRTRENVAVRQSDGAASGPSLLSSWTPPLSTRGRYIVDANGKRFKLRGGNWHGASGTYLGRGDYNDPANHHAGEMAYQTPLCLDRVALDEIVAQFVALGINTVRLPWSNEMLHTATIVPDSALRANPQLMGKYPLQIFDACISALTRAGIAVILNNHTVKSIWCCGLDVNSRWNGAQTDQQWQSDWVYLVQRYSNNTRVVGAELYK